MPTNALSNNRSPSRCTLAAHRHTQSRLPRHADPSAYSDVAQPFLSPPPSFVPLPNPVARGSATGSIHQLYVSSSALSPSPMPRITPTPAQPTSENTLLNSCLASKKTSRPLPTASYRHVLTPYTHTCIQTHMHTNTHAYLPTYLNTYLPSYLHAYLPP